MVYAPEPNLMSRPYRGVSVQEVDVPLTTAAITDYLLGREVYRRTEYLILQNGDDAALVRVGKASFEPLFTPADSVTVLAEPADVAWVHSPETDCGNATGLARAAAASGREALAYVVQGKFEHINFIWQPTPIPIKVTEVVPPGPPKLVDMVEQAIAFDEELPPIEVVPELVDLQELLARQSPDERYLLPCRGSGVEAGVPIDFLDTRPVGDGEPWILVGCERSAQFYRHFYGAEPERVDLCPRQRPPAGDGLTLAKCCLLERGVEHIGKTAVVPWGSNLDEVRLALRLLCGLPGPAVPTVS
jgi:hypothetical protein